MKRVYRWLCLLGLALNAHATVSVVSYWRLGEQDPGAAPGTAATNAVDAQGHANLPITGAAVYSSDVASAAALDTGSWLSVDFSQPNTYARAGVISGATANFGIEAWVKPTVAGGEQVIAYNGSTQASGWGILASSGYYYGLYGGVTYIGPTISATAVVPGVWTHLALVRNGGTTTFYVNGVAQPGTTQAPNPPSGSFGIGTQPESPPLSGFSGLIDNVRVFTFAPGAFSAADLLLNQPPVVGLSNTNLSEGPNAGRDSVGLTDSSGAPWMAKTTNTWLHLATTNGNASTTLGFMFDPNLSQTGRTGSVQVAGQTIQVAQGASPVNIVAYWRMGDNQPGAVAGLAATQAVDLVGNYTLPISGTAVYSSDVSGTASSLAGSGLSVNFAQSNTWARMSPPMAVSQNFGVEAWVKPSVAGAGQIFVYNGNAQGNGWGILASGGNYYGLLGGITYLGPGAAVTPGVWTHLALVNSGGTTSFYVNGSLAAAFGRNPVLRTGSLVLGADPQDPTQNNYIGEIDEVRVFTLPAAPLNPLPLLCNPVNYYLTATALSEAPTGGNDAVGLTTAPGSLAWSATTTFSWLHLATNNGTGSATIGFSFDDNLGPNATGRSGTFTVAGLVVSVSQAAPAYVLATNQVFEPLGAGTDSIGLTVTPSTGTWTATANASWLHLVTNNGTGSATIGFTFDNNLGPDALARSGTMTIAGQTFTVNQGAPLYVLATNQVFEPVVAGADNIGLTVTPGTGSWTATANASWLHLMTNNGTGSATIGFTFDSNLGPNALPRSGTMTIAGQTFTVNQSAPAYVLATNQAFEPIVAGADSVGLTVTPGSGTWTVTTAATWLHLATNNGTGSALIGFTFDSNLGPNTLPRTNTITIAGQAFTVIQPAPVYTLATNLLFELQGAGTDNVALTVTPASGLWSASTHASWLHLATNNGTGSASIGFSFDANPGPWYRSGTLSIAGQTVSVVQGAPLSVTNLVVGPAAGYEGVPLAVSVLPGSSLPATANVPWLVANNTSVVGHDSAAVMFGANTNAAPRVGLLGLLGNTITVTQAGANYLPAGFVHLADFTSTALTNLEPDLLLAVGRGITVDPAGRVYVGFDDSNPNIGGSIDNGGLAQWTPTNGAVTLLASNLTVIGVGSDASGNVFFNNYSSSKAMRWSPSDGSITTLPGSQVYTLGMDAAGDVLFFDSVGLEKLLAPYGTNEVLGLHLGLDPSQVQAVGGDLFGDYVFTFEGTTFLSSQYGLQSLPYGNYATSLAVDSSGNIYYPWGTYLIRISAVDYSYTTLGYPPNPLGLALDADRNLFIVNPDFNNLTTSLDEMPHAFVDGTPKWESGLGGSDTLAPIVPATFKLTPPMLPTSDQPWLTVSGVTNGVLTYALTANPGPTNRVGHINLLGVPVTVNQVVAPSLPLVVSGAQLLPSDAFQLTWTNNPNATFTVLTSTNASLPLAQWAVAGSPTQPSSGLFQFTATLGSAEPSRFYTVRSP